MASMFKKPKINFRQRVATSDFDEEKNGNQMEREDNLDHIQILPEPKKPKEQKKDKIPKSSSVLSFDHEEGDTTFQLKKSSHSKKLAKQLKKEYEQEKEVESKKVVVKTEKPSRPLTPEQDKHVVEDRIKKLQEDLMTMNGDEAAALEDPDSEEEGTFKKMLKRGEIPDATTIHQIRKQRQMARDAGDFMPLDDTVKYENSKSRLVREDDNDKSDDDEDERIDFTTNTGALDRQKMRDNFLRAEHGSDEGSDQEREWEEQQIHMGVSAIQQVSSSKDLLNMDQDSQWMPDAMYNNCYHGIKPFPGDAVMAQVPRRLPLSATENITLDGLIKRLKERSDFLYLDVYVDIEDPIYMYYLRGSFFGLNTMDEVHRVHRQEADKLEHDMEDSKDSIVTCEASVPRFEERFKFFQEMRGYVRDLVECLNEKVGFHGNIKHTSKSCCQELVEISHDAFRKEVYGNEYTLESETADASNEGSHSPETIGISARDLDPQNSEDCSVNERSSFQEPIIMDTDGFYVCLDCNFKSMEMDDWIQHRSKHQEGADTVVTSSRESTTVGSSVIRSEDMVDSDNVICIQGLDPSQLGDNARITVEKMASGGEAFILHIGPSGETTHVQAGMQAGESTGPGSSTVHEVVKVMPVDLSEAADDFPSVKRGRQSQDPHCQEYVIVHLPEGSSIKQYQARPLMKMRNPVDEYAPMPAQGAPTGQPPVAI